MFEHENAFYKAHQAEFHKKFLNKWLVIAGEFLLGAYNTPKEAVENALKHFEPGEFIIHTPARDGMIIKIGPKIDIQGPDKTEEPEPSFTIDFSKGSPVKFTYA